VTEREHSVAQTRRRLIVNPSPLNVVKLELGLIVLVLVALGLLVEFHVSDPVGQLVSLIGIGGAGMTWVLLRTRSILKQAPQKAVDVSDNSSNGQK